MADHSLHTQINVELVSGHGPVPVDITATSPEDLLHTVAVLTGGTATVATTAAQQGAAQEAPTQAAPQQAPQPQQAVQPGPSAADTAQQPAATPSATTTAGQPSQPELTLNDVLAPARQLLQVPGGEDILRQILAQHGAQAISQADPATYGAIKAAIEQSTAGIAGQA